MLAWLSVDWRNNPGTGTSAQRAALLERLLGHAAALLDGTAGDTSAPPVLDAALVARTRLALAMMPLPRRIYHRLKRALDDGRLPAFSVNGAVGRDASVLLRRQSGEPLTRGLSGLYTVAGHRAFLAALPAAMRDIERDAWVLDRQESAGLQSGTAATTATTETIVGMASNVTRGSNSASVNDRSGGISESHGTTATGGISGTADLSAAVLALYYDDYIRAWDALLADVQVVLPGSLDQAARVGLSLAAADSPLRRLLQAAARETRLQTGSGPGAVTGKDDSGLAGMASIRNKIETARQKLESAIGAGAAPATELSAENPVDRHFSSLHQLVGTGDSTPGSGAPTPLDNALVLLKDAAQYFDAAEAARKTGTPAPPPETLLRLKREAEGKPAPLAAALAGLASAGETLGLGSERARLNALWSASAAGFCSQAIAGRYPLVRSSAREITPDDFGRFFAAGGIMDDFFSRYLAPHVDTAAAQWRWRPGVSAAMAIPQEVLNQFQRAARLRDTFFASGARQPSLRFELRPVMAEAGLEKVVLDIAGQPVLYSAGQPAQATTIMLPSGKEGQGGSVVRFETTPPLRTGLHTEGPWAWLRMLDKGVLETTAQGERYRLRFDLDGRQVHYDMVASSALNPLRRDTPELFRCPVSFQ